MSPLRPGGQNHWARPRDGPISLRTRYFLGLLSQPAMAGNLQMEGRRIVEIGLKCECFSLPTPCADNPLQGNVARQQLDGDPGVLEPMGSKTEMCLKPAGAKPSGLHNPAPRRARSLHPLQNQSSAPPVVAGKQKVPKRNQGGRSDYRFNGNGQHHKSSDANVTT